MSHWLHREAAKYPGRTFFIAGRTKEDCRKTTVEGSESGVLQLQDPSNPCVYKGHLSELQWANGSRAHLLTSEEPDGCRGPGYAGGIADELAAWKTKKDSKGNTLWTNIRFATSVKLPDAAMARIVTGTTPRPTEIIRKLVEDGEGTSPRVALTTGTMHDNAENLGAGFLAEIEAEFGGTYLYEQEALGKLLESIEGAILSREQLENTRVDEPPDLVRVAIGVDPAGKDRASSDLTGINASGLGVDGHLYSLANRSCRKTPDGWARAVIDTYWEFAELAGGNAIIVCEDNYGGQMVESNIRGIDSRPRVASRTASQSKGKRAAPVLAYFERGEAHICGTQPALEAQLCSFTKMGTYDGEGSPDDADAFVWAGRELMLLGSKSTYEDWAEVNA